MKGEKTKSEEWRGQGGIKAKTFETHFPKGSAVRTRLELVTYRLRIDCTTTVLRRRFRIKVTSDVWSRVLHFSELFSYRRGPSMATVRGEFFEFAEGSGGPAVIDGLFQEKIRQDLQNFEILSCIG